MDLIKERKRVRNTKTVEGVANFHMLRNKVVCNVLRRYSGEYRGQSIGLKHEDGKLVIDRKDIEP